MELYSGHINKLIEEYYDVNDSNDLEQAQADRKEEIAQAKLARIERIVDMTLPCKNILYFN